MRPTAGDIAAAAVRGERGRRRWTQQQLADRLGWSQAKVSAVETGQRVLTLDQVVDLCGALGVTLSRLLQDADPQDRAKLGL